MLALHDTLAGYRLDRVIGRGGMGVVYEAHELELGRTVALKVIDPDRALDDNLRRRFSREARLAASLDHPNVVPIFAVGEAEGVLYLAMRYVAGEDLGAMLRRDGRLAPPRAARIVAQIAGALDAAHARGLVHRDIKPANVIVAAGDHAYLTDFGIAKHGSTVSGLTRPGGMVGSVDYIAPEQIDASAVGPATDVYGLAATAVHLLAGRPPHVAGSEAALLHAHLTGPPEDLEAILPGQPPALADALRRGLALRPEDRFESAGDLAQAILASLEVGSATIVTGTIAPLTRDSRVCPTCGAVNAPIARFCMSCAAPLAEQVRREHRKFVTVVVVELVGETYSGQRPDPEALGWVMQSARDTVRATLTGHGAAVEPLGDTAFRAVFGAPTVHEDDALRAARAALAVGAALAAPAQDPDAGGVIRARIGIASGEAMVGTTADGTSRVEGGVNGEALRLAGQAVPGEILAAPATEAMVGDMVAGEPVALRAGGGTTERAFSVRELAGERRTATRVPEGLLVGRDWELDHLLHVFERVVREPRPSLLTVLGPAGVGKSRLAGELATRLRERATVLIGSSTADDPSPLAAVGEIVEQLVGERPVEGLAGLIGGGEEAAARIAATLDLAPGDPAGGEELAFALVAALAAQARRAPTVVIFEDVHLAQEPLLDLVEYLAVWLQDVPVMLLCLARSELLDARPNWGGGLADASTLTLDPLSEADSRALLALLRGADALPDDAREQVVRAAEGNPLFIEQMLELVRARGAAATGEVDIPPTINALMAARLDQLDAVLRDVLERAAIVGRSFEVNDVAALDAGGTAEAVAASLRELDRRGLVRLEPPPHGGPGRYRFRHALIRDATYAAIPKDVRADLHARFAAWLERAEPERVEELAELIGAHLERAHEFRIQVGGRDEAARRLGDAAAAHLAVAAERAAHREEIPASIELARRALALMTPTAPDRQALLAQFALLLIDEVEFDETAAVLREITGGDPPVEAGGEPDAIVAAAVRAAEGFEAAGEHRAAAFARLIAGDVLLTLYRSGEAAPQLSRALEHARAAGDDRLQARVMLSLGPALSNGPTPLGEVAERLEAMLAWMHEHGLGGSAALLADGMASVYARLGDAERARALVGEADRHHARIDGRRMSAKAARAAGDLEEAEEHARAVVEGLTRAGRGSYLSLAAGELAQIQVERGELEEAERAAQVAAEHDADALNSAVAWRLALAGVRARQGDHEEALRLVSEVLYRLEPTDHEAHRADCLLVAAEVAELGGLPDEARRRAEEARATARAKDYRALLPRIDATLERIER